MHEHLVLAPDAGLAEAAHNLLDAPLAVVRGAHAGRTLALLDSVRALLEALEAALVHLALGVGAQRGVRLVVLAALDAVLWSAEFLDEVILRAAHLFALLSTSPSQRHGAACVMHRVYTVALSFRQESCASQCLESSKWPRREEHPQTCPIALPPPHRTSRAQLSQPLPSLVDRATPRMHSAQVSAL